MERQGLLRVARAEGGPEAERSAGARHTPPLTHKNSR